RGQEGTAVQGAITGTGARFPQLAVAGHVRLHHPIEPPSTVPLHDVNVAGLISIAIARLSDDHKADVRAEGNRATEVKKSRPKSPGSPPSGGQSRPLMRTLSLEPYGTSQPSRNRLQNPASAVKSIPNLCIAPIALHFGFLLRRVCRDRLQFIVR